MKYNIIKIIVLLSAVLLFSCGIDEPDNNTPLLDGNNARITGEANGGSLEERAEAGYLAPDFSVELLSGETVSLSDFRGKVVLINFWATWCGPCVKEMPDIQKLSEAYSDDLVVLAINCNESKNKVEEFINANGYTFRVGLDSGEVQKLYPTRGIPYTIVINANGVITQTQLGAPADAFAVFEEYVKAAMENQ